MIEIIKTIIMGVFSLLVVIIPIWINRKRKSKKTRDNLFKNDVFQKINELRSLKIPSLSTNNKLKDKILRKYANLLLDIYNSELKEIITTIDANTIGGCMAIHCRTLDKFRDELYKTDLSRVFIVRMEEAPASSLIQPEFK